MMRSMSPIGLDAALIAHRGQMQALVEGLARLAGAASRHRAADVALVRDRAAETEQRAVDEHRADHAHVGRVRAAALVGMIDQEGVAFRDAVAEFRDHRAAAGRKGADMQRQHHVLRHHFALGVHQRAGGVLRFAHDGGEAGAEQRVLHLLHDAGEAGLHDFEIDGVDVHAVALWTQCHARLVVLRRRVGSRIRRLPTCRMVPRHRGPDRTTSSTRRTPIGPSPARGGPCAHVHEAALCIIAPRHDQILPLIHPRGLPRVDHGRAVELVEDRRPLQRQADVELLALIDRTVDRPRRRSARAGSRAARPRASRRSA